jgi:hypothetical protein
LGPPGLLHGRGATCAWPRCGAAPGGVRPAAAAAVPARGGADDARRTHDGALGRRHAPTQHGGRGARAAAWGAHADAPRHGGRSAPGPHRAPSASSATTASGRQARSHRRCVRWWWPWRAAAAAAATRRRRQQPAARQRRWLLRYYSHTPTRSHTLTHAHTPTPSHSLTHSHTPTLHTLPHTLSHTPTLPPTPTPSHTSTLTPLNQAAGTATRPGSCTTLRPRGRCSSCSGCRSCSSTCRRVSRPCAAATRATSRSVARGGVWKTDHGFQANPVNSRALALAPGSTADFAPSNRGCCPRTPGRERAGK